MQYRQEGVHNCCELVLEYTYPSPGNTMRKKGVLKDSDIIAISCENIFQRNLNFYLSHLLFCFPDNVIIRISLNYINPCHCCARLEGPCCALLSQAVGEVL